MRDPRLLLGRDGHRDVPAGCGFKRDPAVAGEKHLGPAVAVAVRDHVDVRTVREIPGGVAGGHAGRNSQAPHQDGHGGAEVFAVALAAFKQEVVHAVRAERRRIDGQVVGVVALEILLHRHGFVVRGLRCARD